MMPTARSAVAAAIPAAEASRSTSSSIGDVSLVDRSDNRPDLGAQPERPQASRAREPFGGRPVPVYKRPSSMPWWEASANMDETGRIFVAKSDKPEYLTL